MRKKVVCDSCKCIRDIPEFVFFFFFTEKSTTHCVLGKYFGSLSFEELYPRESLVLWIWEICTYFKIGGVEGER